MNNDVTDELNNDDVFSEESKALAANRVSANLVETKLTFYGNRSTISQTVQLLAYIRNAIQNNHQKEITVKVGNNVINTQFSFDVNGLDIPDLIAKDFIEIN